MPNLTEELLSQVLRDAHRYVPAIEPGRPIRGEDEACVPLAQVHHVGSPADDDRQQACAEGELLDSERLPSPKPSQSPRQRRVAPQGRNRPLRRPAGPLPDEMKVESRFVPQGGKGLPGKGLTITVCVIQSRTDQQNTRRHGRGR